MGRTTLVHLASFLILGGLADGLVLASTGEEFGRNNDDIAAYGVLLTIGVGFAVVVIFTAQQKGTTMRLLGTLAIGLLLLAAACSSDTDTATDVALAKLEVKLSNVEANQAKLGFQT